MRFVQWLYTAREAGLIIGGHRGHRSETRENTIANFEEAREAGVRYIEIDVQLTRDGQAVIFHDRELSERTPLRGRVRDYTAGQLKGAFDLCTLEEALAWCAEKEMPVLLEIKSGDCGGEAERTVLCREIAEAVRKRGAGDICVPFSSDRAVLRTLKGMLPEADLALIVPSPPEDPAGLMKEMGAAIYLNYAKDLTPALVDTLHRAGYLVDGSVVNTEEELDRAVALNLDMIESDEPEYIRALYERKKAGENRACIRT